MFCKICSTTKDGNIYSVREMFIGLRNTFEYFECECCGVLQLIEIPADISIYYKSDYYSYSRPHQTNPIVRFLKNMRTGYYFGHRNILSRTVYGLFPEPVMLALSKSPVGITKETKILDVGCGGGSLLYQLKNYGFTELLGLDPFIENEITYENGLHIKKCTLEEINGRFDIIMFNHSFEHMNNPFEILMKASELLNQNGLIIVRVPTVDSFAWKHYREDWVQLDAPRHIYLYSLKGLAQICQTVGLEILDSYCDSTEFQFTGSELYKNNISLMEFNNLSPDQKKAAFSKADITHFEKKSLELNTNRMGDQLVVYIQKPVS